MKTFTIILLLAAGFFAKSSAQTTDSSQASSGSLEIILNFQKEYTYGTNAVVEELVGFSAATNIKLEITFRNVGDVIMDRMDLFCGFSIILDGKEYKETHRMRGFDGVARFDPKTAWRVDFPLSEFLIPKEALASGRHTVAVKDAGVESNQLTIFIEPQK
jgi:hypothetical protein